MMKLTMISITPTMAWIISRVSFFKRRVSKKAPKKAPKKAEYGKIFMMKDLRKSTSSKLSLRTN
jgi:hypothetical protein